MVSPIELAELRKAIKKELAKGRSRKQITEDMKKAGYFGGDINLAFRDIDKKKPEKPIVVPTVWTMETNMFSPKFLFDVIRRPAYAFKNLMDKMTFWRGLILYLIVAFVSEAVFIITSRLMLKEQYGELLGVYPLGLLENIGWIFSDKWAVASAILSVMIGLIIFLAFCRIVARLTKSLSKGMDNIGKTVALLAYLNAFIFMVIGLPLTIISAVSYPTLPAATYAISTNWISTLIFAIVTTLLIIWFWILAGKAVAVANSVPLNEAMLAVLFAFLIVFAIIVIIALAAGVVMVVGRLIPMPAGMFIGGF